MKALITLPNYDDATSYLFCYTKEIIDFADQKGIFTIKLSRPRLTKENMEKSIAKQEPKLVLFNAHSDDKTIYGDKIMGEEEYLVKEGENHYLLEGRIIYARACYAAASLGKACTKNSGCFIGYSTPFSFWIDEKWSANPLKDQTARLFLEPSNTIALSLLKGNTAREAVERFNNSSKKNILELLKNKKEPGAIANAMVLWSNIQGQEIIGDKEMRFV